MYPRTGATPPRNAMFSRNIRSMLMDFLHVRHAHEPHRPARTRHADGRVETRLVPHTLQNVVRAAVRHRQNFLDGFRLVPRGNHVRRAELPPQLQPLRVVPEEDDPFRSEPFGRQHPAQAHRPVADHRRDATLPHARRHRRVVARAHHVGQRQQPGQERVVVGRIIWNFHQRAVCERRADGLGLSAGVLCRPRTLGADNS